MIESLTRAVYTQMQLNIKINVLVWTVVFLIELNQISPVVIVDALFFALLF